MWPLQTYCESCIALVLEAKAGVKPWELGYVKTGM